MTDYLVHNRMFLNYDKPRLRTLIHLYFEIDIRYHTIFEIFQRSDDTLMSVYSFDVQLYVTMLPRASALTSLYFIFRDVSI
jgi:hypothetical protein